MSWKRVVFEYGNLYREILIKNTIFITNEFGLEFTEQPEKENYSKDFRAYREIDNFAENFITCCFVRYLILSDVNIIKRNFFPIHIES